MMKCRVLKVQSFFGDEMAGVLAYKGEKVDGRKRSWWRSLLSPEAHLKPETRMPRRGLGVSLSP